jgi:hypothetical protein
MKSQLLMRPHGVAWGCLEVTFISSLPRGKLLCLSTPRQLVQVYVTPTGFIRLTRLKPKRRKP